MKQAKEEDSLSHENKVDTVSEDIGEMKLSGASGENDSQGEHKENNNTEKQYIQLQEGRNTFQQQDLLVPWHLKNKDKGSSEEQVFHRFYHVFKEGELKELCLRLPNVEVRDLYLDCGNWCIILEKIKEVE